MMNTISRLLMVALLAAPSVLLAQNCPPADNIALRFGNLTYSCDRDSFYADIQYGNLTADTIFVHSSSIRFTMNNAMLDTPEIVYRFDHDTASPGSNFMNFQAGIYSYGFINSSGRQAVAPFTWQTFVTLGFDVVTDTPNHDSCIFLRMRRSWEPQPSTVTQYINDSCTPGMNILRFGYSHDCFDHCCNETPTASIDTPCHGASDGGIAIDPGAAVPPVRYRWKSNPAGLQLDTTSTLNNLPATDLELAFHYGKVCVQEEHFTIPEHPAFTANLQGTDETFQGAKDGAVDLTVTAPPGPKSYNWSTGATTEDISNLGAGTYRVTIVDNNTGCQEVKTITLGVSSATGDDLANAIRVYPNPSDGMLYLEGQALQAVQVFDMAGRSVLRVATGGASRWQLDLRGQMPGVYFLEVLQADARRSRTRLILE